ncbi:MAG: hypothetical protein WCF84_09870 [Anaerolineae bacterium]
MKESLGKLRKNWKWPGKPRQNQEWQGKLHENRQEAVSDEKNRQTQAVDPAQAKLIQTRASHQQIAEILARVPIENYVLDALREGLKGHPRYPSTCLYRSIQAVDRASKKVDLPRLCIGIANFAGKHPKVDRFKPAPKLVSGKDLAISKIQWELRSRLYKNKDHGFDVVLTADRLLINEQPVNPIDPQTVQAALLEAIKNPSV